MAKDTETLFKEITVTRVYRAPKALVFACWTDPAHLAAWWGPHGFDAPLVRTDPRPGGEFRLDMRAPNGSINRLEGVYEEVSPHDHLAFRIRAFFNPNGVPALDGRNIITFSEADGVTTMVLTAAVTVAPSLKAGIDGMDQGWSESLERLASLIEQETKS